jgi:rare lipoprotein A (peptidoglycan hydrolase)
VTVTANGVSVRAQLADWCACPGGRVIDLYASAFAKLAPLSAGLVKVTVRW